MKFAGQQMVPALAMKATQYTCILQKNMGQASFYHHVSRYSSCLGKVQISPTGGGESGSYYWQTYYR
jgi:hypothetical protein